MKLSEATTSDLFELIAQLEAKNEALREGLRERLNGSPEPDKDEGYTIFKNKHIRALLTGDQDGI